MKTQIRRGVFETNSSSVHTLSIVPDLPENFKFPEELVFGKGPDIISDFVKKYHNPGDKDYKEDRYSEKYQQKADLIFSVIVKSFLGRYLTFKKLITEQLESVGIKAIFRDGVEDYEHLKKYEFFPDNEYYYDDEYEIDSFEDMIRGDLYKKVYSEDYSSIMEEVKLESKTPFLVNFIFGEESFSEVWSDDCGSAPTCPESNYTFSQRLS